MSLLTKKIEDLIPDLIKDGSLTEDQLEVAKQSHGTLGGDIGEILIKRGYIEEMDFLKKLGKKYGLTCISLATYEPDPDILKLLNPVNARNWKMIPLFEVEDRVTVVTADPFDLQVIDEARLSFGKEIDCVLAPLGEITEALDTYYGKEESIISEEGDSDDIDVVDYQGSSTKESDQAHPASQLEEEAEADKIVNAVNKILHQSYRENASDIHIEANRHEVVVRFRVDGVLVEAARFPKAMQQALISRIKIMGGMDVAEQRITQDGRVRIKISNREVDLRIATYPTIFGEAAAIRALTRESIISLQDLGLLEDDQKKFEDTIKKPHGIFLVTGPTGSGKTTSLYAALLKINRKEQHVLSVEDPVENEIDGVSQTQINSKAGLTFASSLRAILREDPDIIMVGEIRDEETADIAFRAAMTGHLVLSTLHTNSAIGAIPRLTDMGLQRFLVASTLLGVMAQRLVRKICPTCKEETPLTQEQQNALRHYSKGLVSYKGKGCRDCRLTGYKGRIGLFELVCIDDEMRVLITQDAPEVRLREKASAAGSRTILEDGLEKVRAGLTSVDEVLKVAGVW